MADVDDKLNLHKQYLATFDGAVGKAVLDDIMRRCGLMTPSYNSDPLRMAFNEGARSIGLYIHSRLDTQAAHRHLAERKDKQNG